MKYYFVDTNVIMYAHGEKHAYKDACVRILRLIAADEIFGITSSEVLQEILYRYTALRQKHIGMQMVSNTLSVMHEILPVDRFDIILAMDIMKKHKSINVRDAIHAASAIKNKTKYIISADRHFDLIKTIQRIDPLVF